MTVSRQAGFTLFSGYPPAARVGAKLKLIVKSPASILPFHAAKVAFRSVSFSQLERGKSRDPVDPESPPTPPCGKLACHAVR